MPRTHRITAIENALIICECGWRYRLRAAEAAKPPRLREDALLDAHAAHVAAKNPAMA